MRTILVATLLLAGAALAGCSQGTAPGDPVPNDGEQGTGDFTLKGAQEFCTSEADCDFWDDLYHEYVVYDLDTYVLDVLVVPAATADPLGHTAATTKAVEAWRDGIHQLAVPWLRDNLTINVYTLGIDVPPPEALQDPEIVVLTGGVRGLVGIGLEPKQIACMLQGEGRAYPVHEHHGMRILASDCTGYGFTCFAINVHGEPGAERGVYDLVAHEVGHCLGAGHVGDALDFRARYAPVEDIMSYQDNPDQVHCVSSLNVRVLEGVYAHLLGRPQEEWLPRGSYLAYDPALYHQVACDNP